MFYLDIFFQCHITLCHRKEVYTSYLSRIVVLLPTNARDAESCSRTKNNGKVTRKNMYLDGIILATDEIIVNI